MVCFAQERGCAWKRARGRGARKELCFFLSVFPGRCLSQWEAAPPCPCTPPALPRALRKSKPFSPGISPSPPETALPPEQREGPRELGTEGCEALAAPHRLEACGRWHGHAWGVPAWVLLGGFANAAHPRAARSTLTAAAAARWFPSAIRVGWVRRRDTAVGLARVRCRFPARPACRAPAREDPC